jgi:hypothetical protein
VACAYVQPARVKAHAPALRTGFQHPASAVAPERYIGATLGLSRSVAPHEGRHSMTASTLNVSAHASGAMLCVENPHRRKQ